MSARVTRGDLVTSTEKPEFRYRVLRSGPKQTRVVLIGNPGYGPEYTCATSVFRLAKGGAK